MFLLNISILILVIFKIINRSGTFVKGCEGYNHQHTGKWGFSLYVLFWPFYFIFFFRGWSQFDFQQKKKSWKLNLYWCWKHICISWLWKNTYAFLYLQVTGKITALKGLDARLREICSYLDLVIDEKLPLNHEILYHLQVHFLFMTYLYYLSLIMATACGLLFLLVTFITIFGFIYFKLILLIQRLYVSMFCFC